MSNEKCYNAIVFITSLTLAIICLMGVHSLVSEYIYSMDMHIASYDGIDNEFLFEIFVVSLLAMFFLSCAALGFSKLTYKEK